MAKFFVTNNDEVVFKQKMLPPAETLKPEKTKIEGKTKVIIQGQKVCLMGDEKKVKHKCQYKTPIFKDIPGEGEFTIVPFSPALPHVSKKHKVGGIPKIVQKGAQKFDVIFKVSKPAILNLPPPAGGPQKDPIPMYFGKAHFVVKTNKKNTEK